MKKGLGRGEEGFGRGEGGWGGVKEKFKMILLLSCHTVWYIYYFKMTNIKFNNTSTERYS